MIRLNLSGLTLSSCVKSRPLVLSAQQAASWVGFGIVLFFANRGGNGSCVLYRYIDGTASKVHSRWLRSKTLVIGFSEAVSTSTWSTLRISSIVLSRFTVVYFSDTTAPCLTYGPMT